MAEKATRSFDPRNEKLTVMVTREVKEDLEGMAKYYNWSLSKTAHKIIVEGLKAVWADRVSDDFLETT
jgi:hypothetical protein